MNSRKRHTTIHLSITRRKTIKSNRGLHVERPSVIWITICRKMKTDRRVQGVFVELAPNLAGLAEAAPGLDCGQLVSVYIKSIIPEKMKIKLVVLHAMRDETFAFPLEYRLHAGHIGRWIYSVPGAARVIETIFDG